MKKQKLDYQRKQHESKMKFNKINKIILIGGSFSLKEFAKEIAKSDLDLVVFSSKRHLEELLGDISLKDALEKIGVSYYQSSDINDDKNLVKEVNENTLGIAMGAPWIFEKKTVNLFAKNHLLDFMNIDLPRYRGGAHYTWRTLNQNRKGSLNIQIIEGGPDSFQKGGVISREDFIFPVIFTNPLDCINFALKKEINFLKKFLINTKKGKNFKISGLSEKDSSYYPFLFTKANGLINWSWAGKDIYLFIKAFDEPYPGAATYLNGRKTFLKNCYLLKAPERYHPFASGIVIRKNKEGIFVATIGHLLMIKIVLNEKKENIVDSIKLGARFYTPNAKLYQAMTFRADYSDKGLRRKIKL